MGKRMFSHVMVGARDLARLGAFYDAVVAPLGLKRHWQGVDDGGSPGIGWTAPGASTPSFLVQEPFDRQPASAGNGCMVAFLAPSPEAVREAHAAGFAAGGTDEGAPGERPRYALGHYGAHLRDPEGSKLHVIQRGDLAVEG